MKQANIDLTIEDLIMQAADATDRKRLKAALEKELARLLAGQKDLAKLARRRTTRQLEGGQVTADPGAKAGTLGQQAARQIHNSLTGGE